MAMFLMSFLVSIVYAPKKSKLSINGINDFVNRFIADISINNIKNIDIYFFLC